MEELRITLRRSLIGSTAVQRACVATLGLRRIGQSVVRPNDARTAGLLRKVGHLVEASLVASRRAREEPVARADAQAEQPQSPARRVRAAKPREGTRTRRAAPGAPAPKTRSRKANT